MRSCATTVSGPSVIFTSASMIAIGGGRDDQPSQSGGCNRRIGDLDHAFFAADACDSLCFRQDFHDHLVRTRWLDKIPTSMGDFPSGARGF